MSRNYSHFSGLFVLLMVILFINTTASAAHNYDPITGREYDPFGSFFDSYGQYIDVVNGLVVDQYGEVVNDAYYPATDTYQDSKGQVYGTRILAGSLQEGPWFFKDNYYGTSPVNFRQDSYGGLVGQYWSLATYDPINRRENNPVQFTITLKTGKRYYVGTEESQIAWNIKNNMMEPNTKQNSLSLTYQGQEHEIARWLIQESIVDDDGFINIIEGKIDNPDPSACSSWDAGLVGISFKNGAGFKFRDWSCYSCVTPDGVKDVSTKGCLVQETDPNAASRVEKTSILNMGELVHEADWLLDGQDIADTSPQPTSSGQPIGPTPYDFGLDWIYDNP